MATVGKSEKAILNETLVAVTALPETLAYRNNSGQGWQGTKLLTRVGQWVEVKPNMVILMDARPITFGLPGSGDIMGASRGKPLAIEVKDYTGRQSEIQRNFERAWTKAGGLYLLVRSAKDAVEGIVG
jgi:hypothetical protein